MKIIVHNSLSGMSLYEALCYIRHEKPLVWKDGTELAMNVGFEDIVIEPLECDDINILSEYGEGTNFYLLFDLKGEF